jgi:hypothetical protein
MALRFSREGLANMAPAQEATAGTSTFDAASNSNSLGTGRRANPPMQDSNQSPNRDDFSVGTLCTTISQLLLGKRMDQSGGLASKANGPIEDREAVQPDPPEIHYWSEYRQMKDSMLLLTKDVTKTWTCQGLCQRQQRSQRSQMEWTRNQEQ